MLRNAGFRGCPRPSRNDYFFGYFFDEEAVAISPIPAAMTAKPATSIVRFFETFFRARLSSFSTAFEIFGRFSSASMAQTASGGTTCLMMSEACGFCGIGAIYQR